jgi:hypothetical protein
MKVLFAVSNENISESIIKKYQSMYKEIIVSKNVYYFNAIIKELQKDKTYDRVVISEDLEPLTNKNYETVDNFIFEKLDKISDEATTNSGEDIPIILIATDRRTKEDVVLSKMFGIGVYSTLIGQDRSIDEVCKLINKPRTKKEAKIYYKLDSNEIDYKAENEENVSESEIQSILIHYKRLGKNEEKYIESFNSIANQYTDEQLRVIIKFLPLGVKAVLEAECPKYQQISTYANESSRLKKQAPYDSTQINPKTKKERSTDKTITNDGIKIESINTQDNKKLTKPVIIPSTVTPKSAKKVKNVKNQKIEETVETESSTKTTEPEIEELSKTSEAEVVQETAKIEEPVKKGRGRPKKDVTIENVETKEVVKKRRGRPKKVQIEETTNSLESQQDTILPGFEEIEEVEENVLPGFEENTEDVTENILQESIEDNEDTIENVLQESKEDTEEVTEERENLENIKSEENDNSDNIINIEDDESNILPGFDAEENTIEPNIESHDTNLNNEENNTELVNNVSKNTNLQNLLTSNKKIVAFVGTTKNGTSFLVNNLAEILSNQGVKTAILDLTKNRNAYYVYTKNEEALRKIAVECTDKLLDGVAEGIPVNKNLDVYTSLPGENININEYEKILETLLQKYSLVLLDCDFESNYGYINEANEVYLVQNMDVLTIQPFTAYLRNLKAKGILEQNKLKIVINKYVKVRGITERTIIGGMAFYNDPSMSFMSELFNRETIKYYVVPFDDQTYSKYLEGLINCNITTSGYSKESMNSLKKLSNIVYPLIANTQNKYNNPKYNKYIR